MKPKLQTLSERNTSLMTMKFLSGLTNEEIKRACSYEEVDEMRKNREDKFWELQTICERHGGSAQQNGIVNIVRFPQEAKDEVFELCEEFPHLLIPVAKA